MTELNTENVDRIFADCMFFTATKNTKNVRKKDFIFLCVLFRIPM